MQSSVVVAELPESVPSSRIQDGWSTVTLAEKHREVVLPSIKLGLIMTLHLARVLVLVAIYILHFAFRLYT